jgi:hypothetical protein
MVVPLDGESGMPVAQPMSISPQRIRGLWDHRLEQDDLSWRVLTSTYQRRGVRPRAAATSMARPYEPLPSQPEAPNQFLRLIGAARNNGWCSHLGCTTCGTADFRSEVLKWALQNPEGLAGELGRLTTHEALGAAREWFVTALYQVAAMSKLRQDYWTERYTRHTPAKGSFVETRVTGPQGSAPAGSTGRFSIGSTILLSLAYTWAPRFRIDPDALRLADHVLFYGVRHCGERSPAREVWVRLCVELGLETRDESLLESLVWVLREGIVAHVELADTVRCAALNSVLISRAIREVAGSE